ncbi:Gfo/Idh/MocA family protein [Paenarthrobacter nicotinovorans]|uniref:Gfo/Idh/MocA family protein n=1 Tax=Paenarthrobacter nicotinovorans TaxID=29320 RepID=UPI0038250D93
MSTRSNLRVAVVGAGQMGADHVARITHKTKGAVVSAIVEPDRHRAEAVLAEAPGASLFTRIEDAIDEGALDAVLVATPGQFHAPVLAPAIDARLPILVEKPLAMDSASSWEIIEREQKLDRPHIQVGFMRRFDAGYLELRELVSSGELGELLMVHGVHRTPSVPGSYTQEMLIEDSVAHEFDVLPWIAGSPVTSVEVRHTRSNRLSSSHLREPILVLIELANGVLIDVEMNVGVQFGYQVGTEAVFESGLARIGQESRMQTWSEGRVSMAHHTSYKSRFVEAYDRQIQAWVDAVHGGSLIAGPNAWDGYLASLATEAGVKALTHEGRHTVPVPEKPAFYV